MTISKFGDVDVHLIPSSSRKTRPRPRFPLITKTDNMQFWVALQDIWAQNTQTMPVAVAGANWSNNQEPKEYKNWFRVQDKQNKDTYESPHKGPVTTSQWYLSLKIFPHTFFQLSFLKGPVPFPNSTCLSHVTNNTQIVSFSIKTILILVPILKPYCFRV